MIGSVVSHYRVIDRLGAGGMGIVYRAEDLRLGRHVAIKFLPEAALSDPLAVERFQREARTASALNHPNICTLHDVGEHEGRRFIVMELIDGSTLDKVLAAGALPLDRVVEIGAQVADALDAAHTEGILHRDIKPGNVFITRRGQVKVVDFGLAKMMPQRIGAYVPVAVTIDEPHFTTSAGMAVGTVAYMSPEHARGESVDPRSDLFSLGVVIYEMSTGVQTFKGQTTAVIFDQILNRIPLPPSQLNPDVIPALEQIIGRLLEKDRTLRFQTARDLQAELLRLKRDLDSKRVLTSAAAQTNQSVSSAWAAQSLSPAAETMAVNVPIYGVDAEPTPVPAAWAADWGAGDRRTLRGTPPGTPLPPPGDALGGPASISPAAAAAPDAAVVGVHSRPAITPAPVPVASASLQPSADVPIPPPHAATPGGGSPIVATTRPGAAVPATVRSRGARSPLPLIAVGAAVVVAAVAGGWLLLNRGDGPATSAAPPVGSSTPASAEPTAPPIPPPDSTVVPPETTAVPPAPTPPPASGTATPPAPGTRRAAVPPAPGALAKPTSAPPALALPAVEAASMLTRAKSQLAAGAEGDAVTTLSALATSFADTPAGRDGLLLLAQTHQKAGRVRESVSAWTEVSRAGIANDQAAEGLIIAADGAARQRAADSDELARRALGELLARHASSIRALRALQMKMALEDRLKLKEDDEEFKASTPASLLTLRRTARQGGATPVAEFALWRLAQEYRDRRLYEQSAATYTELATRFPGTRYDAWFSAAELYEKQLRDPDRARTAYRNVPSTSSKYDQAQKKIQ